MSSIGRGNRKDESLEENPCTETKSTIFIILVISLLLTTGCGQAAELQVIDDQIELAKEIAASTGADYTHLIVSEDLIESVLSEFDAIPASFFVDSDGNVVSEFYVGSRSKEEWVDIIEENIDLAFYYNLSPVL